MNLTIAVGSGLFALLAWQTFAPLLYGMPTAQPRIWFWFVLLLAAFLLALGLRARVSLRVALRVPARTPRDPEESAAPEGKRRYSSR